jgi:hypothetical protein
MAQTGVGDNRIPQKGSGRNSPSAPQSTASASVSNRTHSTFHRVRGKYSANLDKTTAVRHLHKTGVCGLQDPGDAVEQIIGHFLQHEEKSFLWFQNVLVEKIYDDMFNFYFPAWTFLFLTQNFIFLTCLFSTWKKTKNMVVFFVRNKNKKRRV